jgi:flagellar protein FlgJ
MDFDIVNHNLLTSNLGKIKTKAIDPEKDKELKDACAGFEAIYMHTVLKSMRKTLPGNALFKEDNTSSIYQSMQDQQLSEHLSKGKSSLGLKEVLYESLKDSIK